MQLRPEHRRPPSLKHGRAFTLIEILVVMVIVGILMAVAFLSFGILGDDDNMDREARRLSSLIQLVTDEATTQGRDFGVEFMTAGYRFVEYDPLLDQWFEDSNLFSPTMYLPLFELLVFKLKDAYCIIWDRDLMRRCDFKTFGEV